MALKTHEFTIEQSETDSRWYWHLQARNGEIQADGSQGYEDESACREALDRVLDAIQENTFVIVIGRSLVKLRHGIKEGDK